MACFPDRDHFVRKNELWNRHGHFALLAGCVLALVPLPKLSPRVGYAAVVGILVLSVLPTHGTDAFLWRELPVAGLAAAIIAAAHFGLPLLEGRVLRWLGTVSYGLYLWHFSRGSLLPVGVALPASLLVTALSWRYAERPALRLDRLDDPEKFRSPVDFFAVEVHVHDKTVAGRDSLIAVPVEAASVCGRALEVKRSISAVSWPKKLMSCEAAFEGSVAECKSAKALNQLSRSMVFGALWE